MLVDIGTAHATLHATSRLTTSSVIVPTMYDPRAVLNSIKSAERRPALQSEDRKRKTLSVSTSILRLGMAAGATPQKVVS